MTSYGFDAASRLDEFDLDLDGGTTTSDLALDFAHNPASQIVSKKLVWREFGSDSDSWLARQ